MDYGRSLISAFQESFACISKAFILGFRWVIDTFLMFPNFLRSSSRLATHEATRIHHVHKY